MKPGGGDAEVVQTQCGQRPQQAYGADYRICNTTATSNSATWTVNLANGGSWRSLGIFTLASGTCIVKLSCWTMTGFVVMADAIRWASNNERGCMRNIRAMLLCLILIGTASRVAQAQEVAFNPESVMLSQFTFTRPTGWQWQDTKSRPTASVLTEVIFKASTAEGAGTEGAAGFFSHFEPDTSVSTPKATARRWEEWFKKIDRNDPPEVTEIATRKVTWIEIVGIGNRSDDRAKRGLYGAVIEDKKGNIIARLTGPAAAVGEQKAAFRKMIEEALKRE